MARAEMFSKGELLLLREMLAWAAEQYSIAGCEDVYVGPMPGLGTALVELLDNDSEESHEALRIADTERVRVWGSTVARALLAKVNWLLKTK